MHRLNIPELDRKLQGRKQMPVSGSGDNAVRKQYVIQAATTTRYQLDIDRTPVRDGGNWKMRMHEHAKNKTSRAVRKFSDTVESRWRGKATTKKREKK
jgi:hypothetical protein